MKIIVSHVFPLLFWVCSTHAFVNLGHDGRRQNGFGSWRENVLTSKIAKSVVVLNQTPNKKEGLYPSTSSQLTRTVASGLAALMIGLNPLLPIPSATAATTSVPENPTPTTTVELSRGAIVVQTASETLLKSTVDSKSLLKTLFVNRQELSTSLGRIQTTISQELASPAWRDVQKEFLVVKGDLSSSVQIIPPMDVKETIRDVASGKLNLIVNGELVNIAVQPSFGENQDEVIISIKGVKGPKISPISFSSEDTSPRYGPIRSYFSRYEAFWSWWVTPYPSQYLLPNMQATNGDILLAGTAGTIWLVYLTSYMYYEYEKEQEIKMAEAKRQKTPAKPKKAIAKPEKPAPAKVAKEADENSASNNVETELKSDIVTDPDATDGAVKSDDVTSKTTNDEMVPPTVKTEQSTPLMESRESDRSMTEKENVSSDEQLKAKGKKKDSRRLGWIRFWRRQPE